jgi:hypothetical protein
MGYGICVGFELWSSVDCSDSLGNWYWKNQRVSSGTGCRPKAPGMKREQLLDEYKTGAVGADVTSVRCKGKWLSLGISVDAVNGLTLSIDALPGEEAEESRGLNLSNLIASYSSFTKFGTVSYVNVF